MEGFGNVPFGEQHWAIRRIRLPNPLQEPGEACPRLHGIGGSRFFGGRIYGGGNIIRRHIIVTDQSGLSVRLVHGGKARDMDAFAKKYQRHVHQKNNAETPLSPLHQFLLAKSSSLLCQGGRMCASVNGGVNRVQRPGRAYSSRAAYLCIFFEQRQRRVICAGWCGGGDRVGRLFPARKEFKQ